MHITKNMRFLPILTLARPRILLFIWFRALQGPEYAKTHVFLVILGALQGALNTYLGALQGAQNYYFL